MKVVLDPGHGGSDPGAVLSKEGWDDPIYEQDIALIYSDCISEHLKTHGCDVFLTRYHEDKDLSLTDRVYAAYVTEADAFVSVHANAAGSTQAHGFEVFYSEGNVGGQSLASCVCGGVVAANLTRVRGDNKPRPDTESARRKLYVLRHAVCPAALVEIGFMTNRDDLEKMFDEDWMEKMCRSIADGIYQFGTGSSTEV